MQVNSQKREDIRLSILALLLAHKKGCTLQQLDNDYYELEGEHIPWRDLGYVSLISFLSSMPNVVQIKQENNSIIVKGIASQKSKHVTKLIVEQRNEKHSVERKKYKPSHYYPRTVPHKIHIPAEILSSIISLVNKYPDGVNKNYVLQEVQKLMPFAHINKKDIEEQLYELSHKIFQRKDKIYPIQNKPNNSDNSKCFGVTSSTEFVLQDQKSPIVTVAGNENVDDILDRSQEDIFELAPLNYSSQSLCSNSNIEIKSPSSSVKEVVSERLNQVLDQTSTPQIKQRSSSNIFEIEFNNSVKEDKGCCFDNKDVEMLINDRIKFRLEKLIQNHPNGIWCADLPEKYLEEYKVPLNYIELGFNSVREFASQLPEIFHCIQPYDTGDFRLYYAQSEISLNKVKEKQKAMNLSELYHIYKTSEEEALPAVVSLDTCKGLIPDEVMTIGECVGYISVAAIVGSKEPYEEVVVVEVFTPSFFWIQYRKKQRMFKKFMDDLHKFYLTNCHQYVIPPIVLEKGLNCACIYNGIWHRGIIKTVKPDMQVVVMFYDYGTLKTYAAEAVYYLHRIFSYLPAQAIPCGLINVRPSKGSKWSRSATHNFALKTSQIPLIATVASINAEDNSMMVSLTDTLGEEDVHINDWLVEQKLAEYGKMDDKVDMSNVLLYVEENLLFSPDQCYAEEDCVSDKDNKKSFENVTNIPLILPRSTFQNAVSRPSRETILLNKLENWMQEENAKEKVVQNESDCTVFISPKHNTNPFLEDEFVNGEVKNDISLQKLMQLWNENLQLQMQITERLNVLMQKVMKNSAGSTACNLENIQDILNMIRDTFFHFTNQIPLCVDSIKANPANTCMGSVSSTTNVYNSKNTIANNDIMNAGYSEEYPAFDIINQQPLTTTSSSNSHDVNVCTEQFQNINEQHPFGKISPANSTFVMETDNNFKTLNQCLGAQEIVRERRTLPEFERYSNNETLDQHYFANDLNTDITLPADNSISGTSLKETNPFKLSLADKLHIPGTQDENLLHTDYASALRKQYDSAVGYDLISFENDRSKTKYTYSNNSNHDTHTTFSHYQSVLTDSPNNTNTVGRNLFSINEKSPNCDWNVDNVANTVSKIIISEQCIQHNVNDKSNYGSSSLWKSSGDHDAQFIDGASKNEQMGSIVTSKYNPFSCVHNNGIVGGTLHLP